MTNHYCKNYDDYCKCETCDTDLNCNGRFSCKTCKRTKYHE